MTTDPPGRRRGAAAKGPAASAAPADLVEAPAAASPPDPPDRVDASFLESLVGYSARRAAVTAMAALVQRLAPFDLRAVDFSVLSLVRRNPGITSRQLCQTLDVLPPNLVGIVGALQQRGLVERRPHPLDRRAASLRLSAAGERLAADAERAVAQSDAELARRLAADESRTLLRLLRALYR